MADVFISYAREDNTIAAALSLLLEQAGISSWFDRDLKSGAEYRDQISQQIDAARAVVVLWSRHSVDSLFVKSEAGRGLDQGKLITLQADTDLDYAKIPLPFSSLHMEHLFNMKSEVLVELSEWTLGAKKALGVLLNECSFLLGANNLVSLFNSKAINEIKIAVSRQHAPPLKQGDLLSMLRREILVWPSVIGAAVTIIAAAEPFVRLANWARVFVSQWRDFYLAIWRYAFSFLQIEISLFAATTFTCTVFFLVIAMASSEFYLRKMRLLAPPVHVTSEGGLSKCGTAIIRWDNPVLYIAAGFYGIFFISLAGKRIDLGEFDKVSLVILIASFIWTLFLRIDPKMYGARIARIASVAVLLVVLNLVSIYLLGSQV